MFIVTDFTQDVPHFYRTNDTKDARDIIVGITNSEEAAEKAYGLMSGADFGMYFVVDKYAVECVQDNERSMFE